MNHQYGWANCPVEVQKQIESFVYNIQSNIVNNLIGIYLHGSLAMECFNLDHSDIDLLVVVKNEMSLNTKYKLAISILKLSNCPSPLEISFLTEQDLSPWRHPTPFDLHYSEMWREQYEKDVTNNTWQQWNEKRHKDPDLAAHVTIALNRGICLYGQPIRNAFPSVPAEDYMASILYDIEDASDDILENPVYIILNLCRVYWYLLDGRICSKDEAGDWAADFLPEEFRSVALQALEIYRGHENDRKFDKHKLVKFVKYINAKIEVLLRERDK